MKARERLIVALDFSDEKKALVLVDKLKGIVNTFKVGSELFASAGPKIVEKINERRARVFLDLKLHDIPNTAAKAARSAARLKVFMLNVHSLGGYEMMKSAISAVQDESRVLKIERPKVVAVTILTSMDENGLKKIGVGDNMRNEVLRLCKIAKEASLDGVVASPEEARLIRENIGSGFLIVTLGSNPAG